MKKYILTLTFLFLSSSYALASDYVPCDASEEGSCWPCGDTCTARLSYANEQDRANQRNATITYSGYGEMYDYASPSNNPDLINVEPWYDMRYSISKAVVEDGITSVGGRSIYLMPNLTEAELPNSIQSIGRYAFHRAPLSQLVIPESVTYINPSSLGDSSITTGVLICPESIKTQCAAITDYSPNTTIKTYQKSGSQIFYDNKFYNSAGDIQSGNYIKKRIYTLDEANSVTGKKNTVNIRYK